MLLRRRDDKIELLKRAPLFSGLGRRHLDLIARSSDEVSFDAGKVLARQGEIGREFLIIVDGSANVVRNGRSISRLSAGDFFGEMALLDRLPRTATVTAETPVVLLVVPVRSFSHLLDTVPGLERKLLVTLCGRLRDADERIAAQN